MSEENMMSDEELLAHIKHCVENYKGDTTYMNEAVGLLIVGRIMGWEHQRIVSSRAVWTFTTKVFGDPKNPQFMPKRTETGQRKSVALHFVDKLDAAGQLLKGYLDVVQGKVTIPKDERKKIVGI